MSINRCDICSEISLSQCPDEFLFEFNLPLGPSYYIWLRDMHGNRLVSTELNAESDGTIFVSASDFTENGLSFNRFSTFELSVSTSATEDTSETLTIDGDEFPCVTLSFFEIG